MTTARDLVNAIQSGKSATIQATFDALMTEKIQEGIESYRQAVIDNTFNPELTSESLDEVAYDSKALDDKKKPVIARGVKGMKSTPFEKKFKSMSHYEKWADSEAAGSHEVHDVRLHESDEDESSMDSSIDEEFDLSEYTLEEIQEFMESEDFSTLDELSQNTLKSYINKAREDGKYNSKLSSNAHRASQTVKFKSRSDKDAMIDRAEKYGFKADKRSAGEKNAKDRLHTYKESEEEVSELSKKTLADYAKKAVDKVGMHAYAAGSNSSKDQYKTAVKRMHGAQKAIGKITKKDSLVAHITGRNESEEVSDRLAKD